MNKSYKTQSRFEYKIVVKGYDLAWLRSLVLTHPKAFFIRYPTRWVNNIYFDSESLSSYRQNLSGYAIREKIRFRWYGQSGDCIKGHLELKCKKNGLGWKIIQDIEEPLNLATMNWREIVKKIQNNLDGFMMVSFNQSDTPIIINRYQREYFEAKDGSSRITLDSPPIVYNQRLYNKPNLDFITPVQNNMILELKFIPTKREEMQVVTDNFPFLIEKNSKYILGVKEY